MEKQKTKQIDTSLVDKAIIFAVKAHEGVPRRGRDFPYIVHPLESLTIVATMTSEPELLAAAVLHDVVEDTDFTVEDIRAEFGDRVAELVDAEKLFGGCLSSGSQPDERDGSGHHFFYARASESVSCIYCEKRPWRGGAEGFL